MMCTSLIGLTLRSGHTKTHTYIYLPPCEGPLQLHTQVHVQVSSLPELAVKFGGQPQLCVPACSYHPMCLCQSPTVICAPVPCMCALVGYGCGGTHLQPCLASALLLWLLVNVGLGQRCWWLEPWVDNSWMKGKGDAPILGPRTGRWPKRACSQAELGSGGPS